MRRRKKSAQRKRVGRVSYYLHHGAWYLYYRDGDRPVRLRVADTEDEAEQIAAQVNAQLASSSPTLFSFTSVSFSELRQAFLNHHENVAPSSPATIRRYRSATQHLENYFNECRPSDLAHAIRADHFVAWLRKQKVSPNGHPNTAKRVLRDKGLRFVLEVCRSVYIYAAQQRFLPPYFENPFSKLNLERMRIEDAKPIFVFDAEDELRFFQKADDWTFPIHFILAKTGLRSGELIHLLIEDVDLENGWLHVRNKPELHWKIKTRRERSVPLIEEAVAVLRRVIGNRTAGPVFIRHQFDPLNSPLGNLDQMALQEELRQRISHADSGSVLTLSQTMEEKLARAVWREAGVIRSERVRTSFIRTAKSAGLKQSSCPKSWRHSFATLLQDANVDPLIRQITLGHKPSEDVRSGGLGMTGVYTHTRATTQKREIERALRFWPQPLAYARQWASTIKS
ncbi:tyrosine-type recombinase/integrase [Gimesia benthica]|uniref:Tyrosine-type recombinase/integrase n=1 Tax=Gimesia benthica TaxID=2608982 RepID=A0A6I6AJV4_9PLAN|nr:tyrosine-type recombinase/integrase [Gimesia benthica]QGQ25862.1 tyrosine-type recombinase/integrase [Gimesia benthica]